jgi:hypothetical protein
MAKASGVCKKTYKPHMVANRITKISILLTITSFYGIDGYVLVLIVRVVKKVKFIKAVALEGQ